MDTIYYVQYLKIGKLNYLIVNKHRTLYNFTILIINKFCTPLQRILLIYY